MAKKFQVNLCNKEFWNDFFSPRYPGLFIILVLSLLDTVYTCALVLMSTYYDSFAHLQHVGYLTIFIANMIVIVTGFLSIHFLTLKPSRTKLSHCLFLHLALFCAILLAIATILLMLSTPSPNDIREHTKRYVEIYHRAPYMMRNVMREKQCCGVKKFGDIFKIVNYTINVDPDDNMGKTQIRHTYYRIPPSCCRNSVRKACQKWADGKLLTVDQYESHYQKYLNPKPCFIKGDTFSKIRRTSTYSFYSLTVLATSGVFVFIFGILLVLNYYIWYRFPRMPEGLRPDQFIEDLHTCITCRFGKLRKSLQESKRRESIDKEAMQDGKQETRSNFEARHHKIMQSLANMRAQNREIRQKEQHERQLLTAKSASNLYIGHPTISAVKVHPSNLKIP